MVAPSIRRSDRRILGFGMLGGIGVIVVALVAATALILMLPRSLGPGPIADASPTNSPTSSVVPTGTPVATPTATASATLEPTATPVPTAPPTAPWTGLTWSDPVTPPFTINLWDVVPWRDGYVAVGLARGEFAFLTSSDGVHWAVTQPIDLDWGLASHGWNLVEHRGELVAFAPPAETATAPAVYRSDDGRTWSPAVSASWERAWAEGRLLLDIAAGADAIIAIGDARAGDHDELLADPVVLRSTDGLTWDSLELPGMTPASVVWDVVAWADGYAILGGIQEEGSGIGVGVPQAWWSSDGLAWEPAVVEGATVDDNHFEANAAVAATGGLLARTQLLCAGCPADVRGWLSTDGRVWERASDRLVELPSGLIASDGSRLVAFASDEDWQFSPGNPEPYPGLTRAWVSLDAVAWQPLALSHAMTDQLEAFWVVPDGVIFAGTQSFWFGTPAVGP